MNERKTGDAAEGFLDTDQMMTVTYRKLMCFFYFIFSPMQFIVPSEH